MSLLSDRATQVLAEGGNVDHVMVRWSNEQGWCAVYVVLSGLVDGNSSRKDLGGRAASFVVGDEGQLLVNWAQQ